VAIRGRTSSSGVLRQEAQGEDWHRKEDTQEPLEREKSESNSNHVPTLVDAYTDAALKEWFEDKDITTGLQLSLNKNRLTSLGSNFTDHKKLGFKDEDALAKVKNLVGTQGDPQRNTFGDQLEQMIPSNEWVTFSPGIWFNRDHLTRECRLAIHSLVRVDFIAVTGLGFWNKIDGLEGKTLSLRLRETSRRRWGGEGDRMSEMTFRGIEILDLGIMTRVGVRKLGETDGPGESKRNMG